MRYLIGVLVGLALVLLVSVVATVALPCVTHRLYVANQTENAADFQIMLRDATIWDGVVQARETRNIPIISSVGDATWRVTALLRTGSTEKKFVANGGYMVGHPYETDIYIVVLTSEGIEIFPIEHPFISVFKSRTWQTLASTVFIATNYLRCLDCPKARH